MLQLGPFSMDGRLVIFNVVRMCIVVALRSSAGFHKRPTPFGSGSEVWTSGAGDATTVNRGKHKSSINFLRNPYIIYKTAVSVANFFLVKKHETVFTGAHLRCYSGARRGIRVMPDVYRKRKLNLMDLEVARGDPSQGHLELPNMVMAQAKLKLGSSYLHLKRVTTILVGVGLVQSHSIT
jgi:hypothetical protein